MNPLGVPGLFSGSVMVGLAAVVYHAAPHRLANRALAVALASEGLVIATLFGAGSLVDDVATASALHAVAITSQFVWPFAYLILVSTLDTPLVRPLQWRGARLALALLPLPLMALWALRPEMFLAGEAPAPLGGWVPVQGPWAVTLNVVFSLALLYTFVASLDAWRRAPTPLQRFRAKYFAITFGLRDLGFVVWLGLILALGGLPPRTLETALLFFLYPGLGFFIVEAPLIYGILKYQMFDIDLRIKRTMRTSIVGAALVLLYVGVTEVARPFVQPETRVFVSLAAGGLLLLAIAPLRRAAGLVANAAMPGVSDSAEYLNVKKLEVYRAALEDACAGGPEPAPRDLAKLAALRSRLGITERDHAILLHALRRGGSGPALDLQVGDVVAGRYEVERALGSGSEGTTYLARTRDGGERVVLKALRPGRAGDPDSLREAEAMRRLDHPGVVKLKAVVREGPLVCLVMEHMEGGSLRDRLARGPLARDEFRRLATDLLGALAGVHAVGQVHRDVKPSNVLLTAGGRAKLGDFGIARMAGTETTLGAPDADAAGTVRYMSPEQARGRRTTRRSDLFSAAATLYEAWSGRPYLEPLPGESAVELRMRAAAAGLFGQPVDGPTDLRAWFAKALHPDPAKRFADAREMRDALERALG